MHIALVHDAVLPAPLYGGTERVVWWLAKGLFEAGVSVTLISRPGSAFPYGPSVAIRPQKALWQAANRANRDDSVEHEFPPADLYHYFATPDFTPSRPYLVTIEGNGKLGERYLPNSVFVSRDHAKRHNAQAFIYNGVDPDDYQYSDSHDESLIFLAKASWRVKNVKGAIKIARSSGRHLNILGGSRRWLPHWRGVSWRGMVGGSQKVEYLTRASALLFPVIWEEPFGLAVVEALVSGTPVLASRRGSLPELVDQEVGALCESYDEFIQAAKECRRFNPALCREWALSHFHYRQMTDNYRKAYEEVLAGRALNPTIPFTDLSQGCVKELVHRGR